MGEINNEARIFIKKPDPFNVPNPEPPAPEVSVVPASLNQELSTQNEAPAEEQQVRVPIPSLFSAKPAWLDKLNHGAGLNDLLIEAVQGDQAATALYLVQKGADIAALSTCQLNPRQQEIEKWLGDWATAPEIKPENLNYHALNLGLGYKTANLMVMQKKADKINETLQNCEMKVPPFLGISDCEMQHTLMQAIPELETLWEQFKNSFDPAIRDQYAKAASEGDASKIPLKVTERGQKILEDIQHKITAYFEDKPYATMQMEEWIQKENPQFLIIRSTGREDSDSNSNAGGNDSVPFVKPNAQTISKAMGQVIASYFGTKSIGQRLLVGDRSIFTEKPFIPVLLQVMVGENVSGEGSTHEDIPRSGVLFTHQNDKAEGVTLIQTGLGNNEGVVSGQVGVDSYFIGQDKKIHTVVRKKPTRFVSVEKSPDNYATEAIKNGNAMLENSQALPNYVIQDLKRMADDISASYGVEKGGMKPMDVEYTIKLRDPSTTKTVQVTHNGKIASFKKDKPVIYLLQTRPLLDTEKEPIPKSFLDLQALKGVAKENKLSVETLLDGNAYVRFVDKSEDVLFVETLEEGLEAYTNAPDPSKIKAIISKKTAPAASHPAVILRPNGVAVMVISNADQYAKAREMVQKAESAPILLDPQRGMLVNTEGHANPQDMVKEGLVSYPIPLEMTVPLPAWVMAAYKMGLHPSTESKANIEAVLKMHLHELNDDYSKVMQKLKAIGPLPALASSANPDGATLRSLFDDMAMKGADESKLALAAILQVLHKRLIKSMHESDDFRASLHLQSLQLFQEALRLANEEIIPAIENQDPQTLNRLYPIKFLDALVFQQPAQNVIGGFSYAKVLQTDKVEQANVQKGKAKGVDYSGPNALQQLQLMNMANAAFNPQIAGYWEAFITDVAQAGQIGKLTPMLTEMTQLNVNTTWLNVTFRKAWEAHEGNAMLVLEDLQAQYQGDQDTLKWVADMHKDLINLEQNVKAWENPAYAKKQIESLINKYKEFGFDPNDAVGGLKARYDQSGDFGKLVLLQFMHRAIKVYDSTIKAVSGSNHYPKDSQQKRQDFALLLEGYNAMMRASMKLISPQEEKELMTPVMGLKIFFDKYLDKLQNGTLYHVAEVLGKSVGFNKLVTDAKNRTGDATKQFQARPEFNVDALIIGSKSDLTCSAHWPNNLEEYFTTFHQNMEKVTKFLMTKHGFNNAILAEDVNAVCLEIQKAMPKKARGDDLNLSKEISHIGQEGDKLEVVYQVPLRQHAGTIKLNYHPKKLDQGFDIAMEMFGNDEHDRWDQTATFGALLAANMWGLSYTDVKPRIIYKDQREGVGFSLRVPANFSKKAELIHIFRYIMKEMTMKYCDAPQLQKAMETYAEVQDWRSVPESFFRDAYYISTLLMNQYSDDVAFTRKIAQNSLLGLAKAGLKDYNRGSDIQLSGYLGNSAYSYVEGSGNSYQNKSLVTCSTLHLIKALQMDRASTLPIIQKLIDDPDMQKTLPATVNALKRALIPKELMEEFSEAYDDHFARAIEIAWESKMPGFMRAVEARINYWPPAALMDLAQQLLARDQHEAVKAILVPRLPEHMVSTLFRD